MELMTQLEQAAAFIEKQIPVSPRIGIILGSFLSAVVGMLILSFVGRKT